MEQTLRLKGAAEEPTADASPLRTVVSPRTAVAEVRRAPDLDAAAKRVLDVVVALLALVLALPIIVVAVIAIRLGSPGRALFRQPRVGREGQVFQMLKLRTMVGSLDEYVPKQREDPRVTAVGRFLRTTSVDELPQLWNVIRGEMSLVGPRPLPVSEHICRGRPGGARLTVRPGLTGPWQVQGRNEIPFPERLVLEERYARRRTLAGDLRLLVKTVPAVLSRRGAY